MLALAAAITAHKTKNCKFKMRKISKSILSFEKRCTGLQKFTEVRSNSKRQLNLTVF